MKSLNLGSGNDYRKGWSNLDNNPKVKADIYCDIEKGLPFPNNYFDYIYTQHCLEHIHQEKFDFVLEEIKRVCKNGAIIEIYVPYVSSILYWKTLTHYNPFTYGKLDYTGFKILKKRMTFFRTSYPYREKKFLNAVKVLNPMLSFLPNKFPNIYERLFCWTFPMEELYFKLEVIK